MNWTQIPKRPDVNSDAVIEGAAKMLLPKVEDWILHSAGSHVLGHLIDCIRAGGDGYRMAKFMESLGYASDTELVEYLDNAYYLRTKARNIECERWVKDNNIEGPQIGSTVKGKCYPWSKRGYAKVLANHPHGASSLRFELGEEADLLWEEIEIV